MRKLVKESISCGVIQKQENYRLKSTLQSPLRALNKDEIHSSFVEASTRLDTFVKTNFSLSGDKGKSNKPARILLVGTHGENCKKNVVGEYISPSVDKMLGIILNEYGNIFDIHAHAFVVDANAANSPSVKAFKSALSDIKNEIIDVSTQTIFINNPKLDLT